MSIISSESSLSPRRQSRGKVPEVYGGKTCEKVGLSREWKKGVKECRNDYDVYELPWVKCGECKGDWLV